MKTPDELQSLTKDELILIIEELQKQIDWMPNNLFRIGHERATQEILHEYKNELTSLLRSLEEARGSSPGRLLRTIDEQINWIKTRLHTISAIFFQPSVDSVNINHVIKEVVKAFLPVQKTGAVIFTFNYHSQLPNLIAEEIEIREVFFNLISNAIKAIRKAGRKQGEMIISTEVVEESHIEYVQVTVRDNGIGIRNEDKELIYQKGFTTYEGGVGMGLFITKMVLEKYGGKIFFQSSVGRGTNFTVRIPLKRNRAESA